MIHPVSRRRFVAALSATAGAALTDACAVEPYRLDVAHHDVAIPGLPPGLDGLRIAQVSDVHLPGTPAEAERAAAAIEREQADVVVLTGDMVEHQHALPALAALAPRLRGTLATFAVFGNWEYRGRITTRQLETVYGRAGIELLVDSAAAVNHNGSSLGVLGFDDSVIGHPVLARALSARVPADCEIWLMHAPLYADVVAGRVDAPPGLVLAGHTHGGQIRLPGATLYTPQGSGRYVSGWYTTGLGRMYVSRGIGTASIRARFFCPPELPIFTLRRT